MTAVTAPASGTVFASEADLQFSWTDPGAPVLAMVYEIAPRTLADLGDAIWGAALTIRTTAGWSEGHAIAGGVWSANPGVAPTATPLYFLVEALRDGEVVGLSQTVVFQVGDGGWKQPGDACAADGTIAGECFNAAIPQACLQGQCASFARRHETAWPPGDRWPRLRSACVHARRRPSERPILPLIRMAVPRENPRDAIGQSGPRRRRGGCSQGGGETLSMLGLRRDR